MFTSPIWGKPVILAQTNGNGTAQAQVPVRIDQPQPVPVSNTPTPESFAAYGFQGLIVATIFAVGKPIAEKVYLYMSEAAREKRDMEVKSINAQMRQAEILEEIIRGSHHMANEVLAGRGEETVKTIDRLTAEQAKTAESISTLAKAIGKQLKDITAQLEEQTRYQRHLQEVLKVELYQDRDDRPFRVAVTPPQVTVNDYRETNNYERTIRAEILPRKEDNKG